MARLGVAGLSLIGSVESEVIGSVESEVRGMTWLIRLCGEHGSLPHIYI